MTGLTKLKLVSVAPTDRPSDYRSGLTTLLERLNTQTLASNKVLPSAAEDLIFSGLFSFSDSWYSRAGLPRMISYLDWTERTNSSF